MSRGQPVVAIGLVLVGVLLWRASAEHAHGWMDQVPLRKLERKSGLSGRGCSFTPSGSTCPKKGKSVSFASDTSANITERLAYKMSWEVVKSDGTLYEGKLTTETLQMIRKAQRLVEMASKDSSDMQVGATKRNLMERVSRAVLGRDTRKNIRCGRESSHPFGSVGRFSYKLDYSDGNGCSGLLIGPRHVLTAGHCVHDGPGGDWVGSNYLFRPQQNCYPSHAPLGNYAWDSLSAVNGWVRDGDFAYDYALVTLTEPVGVWTSFGYNNRLGRGKRLIVNGYPMQDKLDYQMWSAKGKISDATSLQFASTTLDIVKGNSGGGTLYKRRGKFVAVGVVAAEVTCRVPRACVEFNIFTRINADRFEQICGWMDTDLC